MSRYCVRLQLLEDDSRISGMVRLRSWLSCPLAADLVYESKEGSNRPLGNERLIRFSMPLVVAVQKTPRNLEMQRPSLSGYDTGVHGCLTKT